MKYRKFGSLDWEASALGWGCMRLPTRKKFFFFKEIDEPEAIKVIRHGIDNGINYVDTAYGYHQGKSEIIVGKALKDGYREKVHLVTKLPIWKVKQPDDVIKYLKEQLDKLQTDYLDIYLVHAMNKGRFAKVKELDVLKKMEEAKESGLIKHIGFSFHDNVHVFKEIIDYYPWDMAQIQYNYMDTRNQATTEGLEYAASKGIAVVIMEPVRGGRLANPPKEVQDIFTSSHVKRTPVDWALQFLWNKPGVSCVISGMSNMKQLVENLESADNSGIDILSEKENEVLEQVADVFRKAILIPCTDCKYCLEVCPSGVGIPSNFKMLNELSQSKNYKKWRKKYKNLAISEKSLNDARDNGMATLCTKCKSCIEQCPQDIDIPTELEKVNEVLGEGKPIESVFPTE